MCQLKKSRQGQINPFGTWPFGTPLPLHLCTHPLALKHHIYILPRAPDPNQSGMFPPTPVRGSLLLQGLKVFKLVISVKNGTFDTKPQSVWVVAAAAMDQSHVALN